MIIRGSIKAIKSNRITLLIATNAVMIEPNKESIVVLLARSLYHALTCQFLLGLNLCPS